MADRRGIVDFHIHLFPPDVAAGRARIAERDPAFGLLYANPAHRMPTAEEAIADMDSAGVAHAVAVGFGWGDPGLCSAHNDYLSDLSRRHPERFSAFGALQPEDPRSAVAELDRFARLGLKGVGELMPHLQGYTLEDQRLLAPVVEAATALGLPVMTHTSEPVGHAYPGKGDVSARAILGLAVRWPDLTVVAAHWGGGLPFYELMPEVAAALRRVYYDTAASSLLYRDDVFRLVAEMVGPERILFGTDYPLLSQRRFIRRVRSAGLSEAALTMILGGNARRLLEPATAEQG